MNEGRVESSTEEKCKRLREIFRAMGKVLVAFSGGSDSTLLLRVAVDTLGTGNVLAVTAASPLYPEREMANAKRMVETLGARHRVIESNELEIEGFSKNPPDRCYFCKRELFKGLTELAREEGISSVVEGSTVDDERDHRPGRLAIRELGIRSPLQEVRFSKEEVRAVSKALGLPTWNKPSFACLASRFPYGEKITEEALKRIDEGETFLLGLGFKQVRVRHYQHLARIEVYPEEMELLMEPSLRQKVVERFKKIGYRYVTLDLQGFRTGSMNEVLQ